jgi:hypothetical protein
VLNTVEMSAEQSADAIVAYLEANGYLDAI